MGGQHLGRVRWTEPNSRWPQGAWQALYFDPNGRERSEKFPPNKKRVAKEWAKEMTLRVRGRAREPWNDPGKEKKRFAAWVQEWKAARRPVRENTALSTETRLKYHLLPEFGGMALNAIDRGAIQRWVNRMSAEGTPRESLKSYLGLLRTILNAAVEDGAIPQNPCKRIVIPETTNHGREAIALTAQQAGTFLAAVPARDRTYVLTALGLGTRAGETTGILRTAVDLDGKRLSIQEQLNETLGTLKRGPTKTRAGTRILPIPPTLVDALNTHLDETTPHKEGYIFLAPKGGLLYRRSWRQRTWTTAVMDCGLYTRGARWFDDKGNPATDKEWRHAAGWIDANGNDDVPLDFHDLRRSFASAHEDRGTPRHVVQALLGHATSGGVIDVYVLVGPEAIDRATSAIDSYLKEVLKAEEAARPGVEANRRQRIAAQRERMKRAQAAGRARKRKEQAHRARTQPMRKAG